MSTLEPAALLTSTENILATTKRESVAAQVEKDFIVSISIGILSTLIEEFLGKPFLPESPHSPLSPELGDCIIPNRKKRHVLTRGGMQLLRLPGRV
jgi:hypothetical protein